jgi:hypothetical protein
MEPAARGRAGALVPDQRLVDPGPVHIAALQRAACVLFSDEAGAGVLEPSRHRAGGLVEPHQRIVGEGGARREVSRFSEE